MKTEQKYAPISLNEVIFPNIATERRLLAHASGQLTGHILLHGPNGTAKTTTARLLIEAIGGKDAAYDHDYDVLSGKADLKLYLLSACSFARFTTQGKHFLLLNEFDTAQRDVSKLWTAMDACGDDLMVIITTNNPMKVHRSIRSRCTEIELPALPAHAVLRRAQHILTAEGLVLPDAQVLSYLSTKQYAGDGRKYWAVLDELLYLKNAGMAFPKWSRPAPKLGSVKRT